jgi:hypothetical protein
LPAFPSLWINEIQADHSTGLRDNNNELDPWIEIFNSGSNAVSFDGLFLSSSYTNLTNWSFPAGYSIAPTQFLVIFCDAQPAQAVSTQLHTGFRLPAISGSIALSRLYNGQPQVVDYVNYQGLNSSNSYGSFPDGQPFERKPFYFVTPRGTNDGRSAPATIFINEWMAANSHVLADADQDFEDWIELYNPGTNAVDVTGYSLTDTFTNHSKYVITTNSAHIIPAKGYLLIWADEETGQNVVSGVPQPDLHVNFKLATSGEEIGLYSPDGAQVDAITFEQQTNDVSMGRYPDGSANIVYMPGTASPRAANYVGTGNTPPVLGAMGFKTIFIGETVSFTATATDTDAPPQTLTFSLEPVPPAGAAITSAGAFTWQPAAVGTFPVTIRVTDDGIPPLTDTKMVSVEVLSAPRFNHLVHSGIRLELGWDTRAGLPYAVDYKSNLNVAQWLPVWTNVATGSSLFYTNFTTNGPQGYFRIRAATVPAP